MLTVAARPSPKAAITFIAYMRKNAGRHCQKMCISGMVIRKASYITGMFTRKCITRDCGAW